MYIAKDLIDLTPIGYVYDAYKQSTQSPSAVNPEMQRAFEKKSTLLGNLKDAFTPEVKLNEKMKSFFETEGFRKDIVIEERPVIGASSLGTNYFTSGYAAIWISSIFVKDSPATATYMIKECAYRIRANSYVVNPTVVSIISIASFILCSSVMTSLPAFLVCCTVAYIANKVVNSITKTNEIKYAIEKSTDKELIAGRNIQSYFVQKYKEAYERDQFWLTPEGEERFEFFLPTRQSIIARFDAEISRRDIKVKAKDFDLTKITKCMGATIEAYNKLVEEVEGTI
jgi:hypothetical protein